MSQTGLEIVQASPDRHKIFAWRIAMGIIVLTAVYSVRDLEWDKIYPSWQFLLTGLGRSWLLAVVAIALGAIAAIPLALLRVYGPRFLRYPAIGIIEVVRATPELMIIFWVYFTLPIVTGQAISSWQAAILSLSVIAAAYLAEVIRAGLYSVGVGQQEAGFSTGMTSYLTFRYVILPQALRNMVPALIAQLIALFKTTSLVYAIGVMEFLRSVIVTNNAVFAPYPLYITLGVGYFVSCFVITRFVRYFDPKYQLVD
jgi:His/Glu/Gln/Arg/opine family amino acid ABC transporter permease subunit